MARTKKDTAGWCAWTEDEDGNWDTGCDEKHVLNTGTPAENGMRYCCYCGNPVKTVARKDS